MVAVISSNKFGLWLSLNQNLDLSIELLSARPLAQTSLAYGSHLTRTLFPLMM